VREWITTKAASSPGASGDLQDQPLPTCIDDDAIDQVQMICQVPGRIDQPARHLPANKGYAWLTPSAVNPGTTVGASGADRAHVR
jgi:hypothetical protein